MPIAAVPLRPRFAFVETRPPITGLVFRDFTGAAGRELAQALAAKAGVKMPCALRPLLPPGVAHDLGVAARRAVAQVRSAFSVEIRR